MAYVTLVPQTHSRPYVAGDEWRPAEEAERVADNLDDHETRILAVEATGGAVKGPGSSVASEIALFDGTTGKLIKRATGSGFVRAASGVYSASALAAADFPATIPPLFLTITDIVNADIKKLPSTPITVVANAGSGFAVRVVTCALYAKFAAGAYSGVDTTFAYLALGAANSVNASLGIANDNTTTPAITQATKFFDNTNKRMMMNEYMVTVPVAASSGYVLETGEDGVFPADLFADLNNTGIALTFDNNGNTADLTGGNAANVLRVFAYWYKEQLP